jgi:threonine dehydrogenase-like Zn-dependent dehydrogenase
MCVRGRTNLCLSYHPHGFHRDGGMAEYVTAPMSLFAPAAAALRAADHTRRWP